MLTLGLDTTTAWCSLGLRRADEPLAEIGCRRHSREDDPLLPALERLLDLAQVEREALELVAVALGPGSFTSLRVGLALGKGLTLGLGIPLVGVASLPLYAARAAGWPGAVGALIGDRPGRVFLSWFQDGAERVPPRAISCEALTAELADKSQPVLLIGPAERLTVPAGAVRAAEALNRPSGLEVARAGWRKFKELGADDPATLEPLYAAAAAIHRG